MGITVNTSPQQITASVGETQIDVSVSGGFGPSGNAGPQGPQGPAGATGPQGPAGTTTWAGITDKPSTFVPSSHTHEYVEVASSSTYTNFLQTAGNLGGALSGIDSALGDRALASDFDQGVKTTDSPQFDGLTLSSLTMSGGDVVFGSSSGAFQFAGFGRYLDIEQGNIGHTGIDGWNFSGDVDFSSATVTGLSYAALSHAHSVADLSMTATDVLVGRSSSGAGAGQEIVCTAAGRALLDDADAAAQRTTLGLGTAATSNTGDFAAASHNHAASAITSGTLDIARIPTGTSSTTVSLGDHTHSQLHDRSHAITSTSDHTAGNWKVFHSNGSGQLVELAVGASGTVLKANGTSSAPTFSAIAASQLPVVLEQTQAIGNSGASKTLDLTTGSVQTVTLSASCTFTMPTATAGASITLILTQGSNYTATFTGVKWPGGTAPTITATANAIDVLVFVSDGTNWYGAASQKFS